MDGLPAQNIMRYLSTILISLTLIVAVGCSGVNTIEEKPAQELVQDGVENYDDGHYSEAIKNFQQLKDWYPFSRYAILAELKIADSYYHLQEYQEAITAYEEFEQLHPRNEAIPYVIFQIGQCHYEQIDSIDRDQTAANNALKVYRRLIRQFPDHAYARRGQARMTKCLKHMAGHDFYVGEFYFKNKRYKAALKRFLKVIQKYPDMGIHHKALFYISACEALIAKASETGT